MFKLRMSRILKKKKIAVNDSNTPVTFKQDQTHQTWYESVHLNQGYINAKFETTSLNNVRKKPTTKFSSNQEHFNDYLFLKSQVDVHS